MSDGARRINHNFSEEGNGPMEGMKDWQASGGLRLSPGALLSRALPARKVTPRLRDRVEGMLLGLAVGDSLGNTSESSSPHQRTAEHGEIHDYLPNPYNGERRGYPSDDTQLSAWTLEHLLEHGRIQPQDLGRRFAAHHIVGIGSTVKGFLREWKNGRPWWECGQASAGNGALMRIAPVLLPHLTTGGTGLWEDVTLAAALTHNDASSTSACLAFCAQLVELLELDAPPSPDWWWRSYVEWARDLEGEPRLQPGGGQFLGWQGPLWRFVEERIPQALKQELTARQACDSWYSGAFLLETVPSALFILARHAQSPEEAIVRAVNDTRDNDTVAAIVGAAVGALHGASALNDGWVENLTGIVEVDQGAPLVEGRYQRLVTQALDRFLPLPV